MSMTLKLLRATVRLLLVAAKLKAVISGAVMSIAVLALRLAEIFPAASRTKA